MSVNEACIGVVKQNWVTRFSCP